MSGKFDGVLTDEETTILFRLEAKLGDFDVLYEKWVWGEVSAESLIFTNEDVAHLTDAEIETEVKTSPLVKPGSSMTLKRSDSGFTFVNFNFET